ncbi:MAG: hypothetical protein RLZZ488_2638 [Pseudomonadota bacterium]|jgi:hypothetical protein
MKLRCRNLSLFISTCLCSTLTSEASTSRQSPSKGSSGSGVSSRSVFLGNTTIELENLNGKECPVLIQLKDGILEDYNDGMRACSEAPIQWIGKGFMLKESNKKKATWVAEMDEEFKNCRARTSQIQWNNITIKRNSSHIILDINNSQAIFSVDIEKLNRQFQIANSRVTIEGQPVWCWNVKSKHKK